MSKWVQHKSGQGEKYVAEDEYIYTWKVPIKERYSNLLRWDLPKSEYVECSPPEEWQDVTEECDWGNAGEGMEAIIFHRGLRLLADRGYRLRKIKDMYNISYFIVERRKS